MGIVDLLVVSLVPVGEVLLITAIGLCLATDRIDLLGPSARHILNNLVFYVFSPALVVSQLAESITFSSLVSLWFMPVNILVTFIIGTVLAWVVIKLTRAPPEVQGLVIGSCSAGNLGNLLLIIVPAVCEESNSPFGDATECSTLGEAYASLSMAVGAVYIWTYVYFMMGIYRVRNGNETEACDESGVDCTQPFLPSTTSSSNGNSINSTKEGLWGKAVSVIGNVASKIDLKKVFAPSTIATIIGFMIGSVSPIRTLIIGTSAPLRVLYNSASLLGDALIPSMTLIVGANLLQGLKREGVSKGVILGIVGVRYVVMPVVGIGVVKAAQYVGAVGSDKLYQFVLMLQYGLPPAMTISIIAQLFEAGESQCSVIMLWTYAIAAFSLTLWSTFYLWLLQ